MLEECFCCGAFAPAWEESEYAEWTLELDADGAYLGVICPGCFAGEGLVFAPAEAPPAAIVKLKRRSPGARSGRDARYAEAA